MPPTKEVVAKWAESREIAFYLSLPHGHPSRSQWLRSSRSEELPRMRGYRGRSQAQIQKLIRKETFGGRFKCHNCDLRFKTRKARRHHEKYSHKHVGRIRAVTPLVLFGGDATPEEIVETKPFNPPRKRHHTRSSKP